MCILPDVMGAIIRTVIAPIPLKDQEKEGKEYDLQKALPGACGRAGAEPL